MVIILGQMKVSAVMCVMASAAPTQARSEAAVWTTRSDTTAPVVGCPPLILLIWESQPRNL